MRENYQILNWVLPLCHNPVRFLYHGGRQGWFRIFPSAGFLLKIIERYEHVRGIYAKISMVAHIVQC